MPRGFGSLREAAAEIEARRSAGGGTGAWIQFFKLNPGQSATVRFLEQGEDIAWAWMHQLQPVGKQQFGDWEVCLNTSGDGTPCPGCERDMKRKVRGYINLIWRDGPIWETETFKKDDGTDGTRLKKDPDGNLVLKETGPILALWNQGVQVFEELDGLDAQYKGLMTRDFKITRKGEGLNTKYQILPLDPEPMSEADLKMAEGKQDLGPKVTPTSYDQFGRKDGSSNGSSNDAQPAQTVNPFMRPRES